MQVIVGAIGDMPFTSLDPPGLPSHGFGWKPAGNVGSAEQKTVRFRTARNRPRDSQPSQYSMLTSTTTYELSETEIQHVVETCYGVNNHFCLASVPQAGLCTYLSFLLRWTGVARIPSH